MLHTALDDAGMLDRKGRLKAGRVGKPQPTSCGRRAPTAT